MDLRSCNVTTDVDVLAGELECGDFILATFNFVP
jgi:hypothetical protein